MKKFTFLIVALLIAAMGFAQVRLQEGPNVKGSSGTKAVTGTLKYCGDMVTGYGIGTSSSAVYSAAARFEASNLRSYVGQYITKISVGINDASCIASARVAIMTGTTDAPNIVMSQECSFVTGVNTIVLDTAYRIQARTPIMIAYEVTITGGYPLGRDAGSAVTNGDLIGLGPLGTELVSMNYYYGLNYNFVISATVESSTISVESTNMFFIASESDASSAAQKVDVSTAIYGSDIDIASVTTLEIATDAPFEVSTDNTNFGTSATMTGNGPLYVRYVPAQADTVYATGTATISSVGVPTRTIRLSALKFNCPAITSFPYEEDFDGASIGCWGIISNNEENAGRMGVYELEDNNVFRFSSDSVAENENYNQYLITPKLSLTGDAILSFDYANPYGYDYETFRVIFYVVDDNNVASYTTAAFTVWSSDFETYSVGIPANTKYIAINYYSSYDRDYLYIDNFSITVPSVVDVALTSLTPEDNYTIEVGDSIIISGDVLNKAAGITSYKVSYTVDGGEAVQYVVDSINLLWDETDSFTCDTAISGLTAGEHTIVVTISEPNGTTDADASDNSMTITVNVVDCSAPISEFPYEEGFENGIPYCWTLIDANGDGINWMALSDSYINGYVPAHSGSNAAVSESYRNNAINANNWMITPAIELSETAHYKAQWYAVNYSTSYPDTYRVYIGTEPTVDNMTSNEAVVAHRPGGSWEMQEIDLSEYAGQTIYIGFNHNDYNEYVILIDEFSVVEVLANDIAVTNVSFSNNADCGLTTTDLIVTVKNNGIEPISSFGLSYSINGGTPVEATVTPLTAISSFGTYQYTIEGIDVSTVGSYNASVTATLEGDSNTDDNTKNAVIAHTVPSVIPYNNTFDTEEDMLGCSFIDANNDGVTWGIYYLSDSDNDSVPAIAFNYPSSGNNDYFVTGCITMAAGTYRLTVDMQGGYYYSGYYYDGDISIVYGTAPTADALTNYIYNVSGYYGQETLVREFTISDDGTYYIGFRVSSTNGYQAFFNNLKIEEVPEVSVKLVDIVLDAESDCVEESTPVLVTVENDGTGSISSFNIAYTVNNGTPVTETITPEYPIEYGESRTFELETPISTNVAGEYNVQVYVTLEGDENHTDDTLSISIEKLVPEIEIASVSPVDNSVYALRGQSFNIGGSIINYGCLLTSYVVSYKVNDGEFVDDYTVYCNEGQYESHYFTHNIPFTPEVAGEYRITVKVSLPNGVEDVVDDNEMVTTITLVACDTVTTFPYEVNFEDGIPTCWYLIDADGDGSNWTTSQEADYYNEDGYYGYNSSNAALSIGYNYYTDNNWMITKAITIPADGNYWANWYASSPYSSEYSTGSYYVYIGTAPTTANMTSNYYVLSHTPTDSWTKKSISLAAYAGQTIYIGFKYSSSSSYSYSRPIFIDDFMVTEVQDNDIEITEFHYAPSTDCGSNSVYATILNNGDQPISSFVAAYMLNDSVAVSDTINLGSYRTYGQTYSFEFSAPVVFDSVNEYNIKVYATLEGDEVHANDTITGTIEKRLPEIELTSITPAEGGAYPNTSMNVRGTIVNHSCDLTSYIVTYKIGEGDFVENDTIVCNVSEGYSHTFTHSIPFEPTAPGEYSITVKVLLPNGVEDDAEDNEMTANFDVSCKITVLSANDRQGYVSGSGYYVLGTDAVISAIENDHYYFTRWNDGNTDNPRTVTVTEETTYIAVFETDRYNITVETSDEEQGSVSGGGMYELGAVMQISAEASEGYRFLRWSNGSTTNPRSITVSGDATYIAYFEALPQYTITVYPSSEEYGSVTGGGTYFLGQTVTIAAIPSDGYVFTSWNDDNRENPRTITVYGDAIYIANFSDTSIVTTYTLTVTSSNDAHGTVTGGGTYAAGSIVTLTATANEGYSFAMWSDQSTENPRQIMVTEDATYMAMFEEEFDAPMYTVTVISSNPSRGTVTGGGTYPEGTVITIAAEAFDGYAFSSWSDGDTANPRQVIVMADETYAAMFVTVTDIEDNVANEISIFPNPATDILNITSSETISEIEIVNMMGQIVRRIDVNADNAVCDVEDLRSGMYIVRIHTMNGDSSQRKFVKE